VTGPTVIDKEHVVGLPSGKVLPDTTAIYEVRGGRSWADPDCATAAIVPGRGDCASENARRSSVYFPAARRMMEFDPSTGLSRM